MAAGVVVLAFRMQAMATIKGEELKGRVRDHWDAQACGTQNTVQPKFTREYFDEIEASRYELEPFIFSFSTATPSWDRCLPCASLLPGIVFL